MDRLVVSTHSKILVFGNHHSSCQIWLTTKNLKPPTKIIVNIFNLYIIILYYIILYYIIYYILYIIFYYIILYIIYYKLYFIILYYIVYYILYHILYYIIYYIIYYIVYYILYCILYIFMCVPSFIDVISVTSPFDRFNPLSSASESCGAHPQRRPSPPPPAGPGWAVCPSGDGGGRLHPLMIDRL